MLLSGAWMRNVRVYCLASETLRKGCRYYTGEAYLCHDEVVRKRFDND